MSADAFNIAKRLRADRDRQKQSAASINESLAIVDAIIDEYDELIKTVPFNDNSKLLDIGSGTGYFLNVLSNNDINAIGLEKSTSMKNNSENLYPNIYVINGDANDPKTFDRTSFSHITMLSFTFYEFEEQYNLQCMLYKLFLIYYYQGCLKSQLF